MGEWQALRDSAESAQATVVVLWQFLAHKGILSEFAGNCDDLQGYSEMGALWMFLITMALYEPHERGHELCHECGV